MSTIKYFIAGILCLLLTTVYSQQRLEFPPCESASFSCPDYQNMLDKVYRLLDKELGFKAYDHFQLLESCDDCPEHQELIKQLGRDVLERVAHIVKEKSQEQLNALQEEYNRNRAISQRLRNTNEFIEQQLAENERMTRDALATNYIEIAREKYNDPNDINGKDAAHWLTDFTYAYIDSTHQEVQKMMYQLFFQKMKDNLPYTFHEDSNAPDDFTDNYLGDIERSISTMRWSSDSLWLAVGTNRNEVLILSGQGEVTFSFTPRTDTEIFSLDWNKNNNTLAVASANTVDIITYDKFVWRPSASITRNDYVRVVRWSPIHAQELALAGDENQVFIYDRNWDQPEQTAPLRHENWIRALDWSPGGDQLVSGDDDGRVIIWAYNDDQLSVVSNKIVHEDYIRSIDWNPKKNIIASGADDGKVYFQDSIGQVFKEDIEISQWITKLAYSPNGQQLGIYDNNNTFHLVEDFRISSSKKVPEKVQSFDWLGADNTINGEGLIESFRYKDGSYPLIDHATIQYTEQLSEHELNKNDIHLARWSPDGEMLAYAQNDQLLVKKTNELHRVILVDNQIIDLDWHPGLSSILPFSNFFATTDKDSTLAIWDALTLYVEKSINLDVKGTVVRWTPKGDGLVIGDENGLIGFYNKNLELLSTHQIHEDQINDISWSPNGKYLAITAEDKTAIVWDVFQQEEKAQLQGHSDWLHQIVWLNDKELASSGDDQQIIIWSWSDAKNNYIISQKLTDLEGAYLGMDVDRNSRLITLVAGTYNGELGIWQRDQELGEKFELNTKENYQSNFSELNWHPNGRELLFSSYTTVPEVINFNLVAGPAFDITNLSFFDRSETKRFRTQYATLKNHFYLPEIEIDAQHKHLIQWSADERLLAFSKQKKLEVHDFEEREIVYLFNSEHPADFITFSPDQSRLVLVDQKANLNIWSTSNWESDIYLELGDIDIQDWSWSADSRYLAILSSDFQLYLYDTNRRSLLQKDLQIDDFRSQGTLLFHPTNNNLIYLAICVNCFSDNDNDYSLLTDGSYLYEVNWKEADVKKRTILPKSAFRQEDNYVSNFRIRLHWADEEGNRLVIHPLNERIYTIELGGEQAEVIQEFGTPNTVSGLFNDLVYEYAPMSLKTAVYKSTDREYLKFWNPVNGQVERKLLGIRKQRTANLSISEEAGLVAALGIPLEPTTKNYKISETAPQTLNIWALEGQRELVSLPVEGATKVDFSPKGKYVLLHFTNGRIAVWPHDISFVASYLKNADKDYFFTQSSISRQVSAKNKIEDWGLERGLNVDMDGNLNHIINRESTQIRSGWSAFFLEQAWLANDNTVAEAYFNKAQRLHINDDGTIKKSRLDTLAVAKTLLDQAFFYLTKVDLRTAQNHLRSAQRKLPQEELLQQGSVLLMWQKGDQEAVFTKLTRQDNNALESAYERLTENDLTLQDNLFFERILATLRGDWDPGLNKVNPRPMSSLLADFDPETTRPFLEKYYYINSDNFDMPKRQLKDLLTDALDFFDDEHMPQDKEERVIYLNNIVIISNNLIKILMDDQQFDTALTYAGRNVQASKAILKTDIRDDDYRHRYFHNIKRRGLLMAINNPKNLRPIYQMIANAESTAKVKNDIDIQLLRGHLAALERDKNKAYKLYFELLNSVQNNFTLTLNLIDIINYDLELLNIDRDLALSLHNQLDLYKKYQDNLNDLRFTSRQRALSPYLEGELLESVLENLYTKSQSVIFDGKNLVRSNYLPKEYFDTQIEEFNKIGSELAWYHLSENNFDRAQEILDNTKSLLPEARWPNAVYAILLSTQEEKRFELRNALYVCRTQKNDGFRSAEYPTLRQRLLIANLPESISQHPVFIKNKMTWGIILNN